MRLLRKTGARAGCFCQSILGIIEQHFTDRIVGHNSRGFTSIDAREKPVKKAHVKQKAKDLNVERVKGRLKDEFGGRMVRVRSNAEVMAHLMFGILALTVDQLLRFIL